MELLIYAGGRWRRVCPASGRVAGWRRRARIACNRRGVLTELPPLSALASIIKGPHLPRIRKPKLRPLPEVNSVTHTGSPSKSVQPNTAVQPITAQKDACIQTDNESIQLATESKTLHNNKTQTTPIKTVLQDEDKENRAAKRCKERNFRSVSTEILELRRDVEQNRKTVKTRKLSEDENVKDNDTGKSTDKEKTKSQSESTASSEDHYKELIIDEDDVLLLRQYIETHDTGIDLYRFDVDDYYKTLVFYKINPLVRIERSAQIAQMIKDRDVHVTVHFARQLGLRSVNDNDEADANKKRRKHRAAKEVAMARSIESESNSRKNKKANKDIVAGVDYDTEKTSKNKTNKEQKTKIAKSDSVNHNAKIFENIDVKKVTQETVDSENKEKQTKVTKLTAEELNNEIGRIHKKAKTLDEEPKLRYISDSDGVDQTNDKNKNINNDKRISTESDDEQTFESSKLRERFQRNITKTTQDNTDRDVRKVVEDKTSKNSEINKSEEKHQAVDQKRFYLSRRRITVPKRSSVRPGREYTMLEDQAIVAWISLSTERERAVNGNRIWKELEEGYSRLTGQTRSWHSIRNRYLRYILPGLNELAIPTAHAQRLRAHATIGELKARKKMRRNSAFRFPAVRGASSRAPRPPLRSPTPKEITDTRKRSSSSETSETDKSDSDSSKRRRLRSSHAIISPRTRSHSNQSPNKRNPTPSHKKSNHQSRSKSNNRRQSPNKATSSMQSQNIATSSMQSQNKTTSSMQSQNKTTSSMQSPNKGRQSPNKPAYRTQSPRKAVQSSSPSSPTYSELTKRFALRNRSTPHPSPTPTTNQHKRRLYNPLRLVTSNSSLS